MAKLISFGSEYKSLTLSERISNSLKELASSIGVILLSFTILFSKFLDPREIAQDVEDKGLIENICELEPAIIAIDKYILLILGLFFAVPIFLLAFY